MTVTTDSPTATDTTAAGAAGTAEPLTGERSDLLEMLRKHRFFLRYTTQGLSDEQAAQRSTVSALCLGGLIKHVAAVETQWANFIVVGASEQRFEMTEEAIAAHLAGFTMCGDDTLEGLLAAYGEAAARTDHLVAEADLDHSWPLPEAPWFEPGARWSVRRVLMHIIAETAQHAGHADIIREAIDGQKSMG